MTLRGVACLALLAGCASVKDHPLPAEVRPSLAGREISVSRPAPAPRLELQGATRSDVYAVVGVERGNVGVGVAGERPLPREPALRIDDPAGSIGRALAATLQSRLSLRQGSGGLVLHVGTTGWGAERGQVFYRASARLVDSRDGRELAESRCDARVDSATYAELVAAGGARLNADLAKAAERCLAGLEARIL